MSEPELSVVVPSVNGLDDLLPCLDALMASGRQVDVEVLVVDRCGEPLRNEVAARFPSVRVVPADPATSIPDLRAIGFGLARSESVAVIEDHVQVPADWAQSLVAAQRRGEDVVGGSVENAATGRLVDWAAFLCEYSHLLPPLPAGPSEWLTGNNIVYRRALLMRYREATLAGRWEDYLHSALRRDGVVLTCRPEICVRHKKHYSVGEYVSQRYLYARSYAGARVAGAPLLRRLAYGFAAFALPPLLLYRIVSRVGGKPGYRHYLVPTLPLIIVFVTSWAVGEVVGYWSGAGDALSRVC